MKNYWAFCLASWIFVGSLMPYNDIEELYKIPALLKHYQTEHAQLSWIDFWLLHYPMQTDSDNTTPSDSHSHQDLPFKNHNHGYIAIYFLPQSITIELPKSLIFSELNLIFIPYIGQLPIAYSNPLLQPPQG